jgi:hypothetical protein
VLGEALLLGVLEVVGSEVAINEASLEHDVDGGQHGSRDGDDRLLGSASGVESGTGLGDRKRWLGISGQRCDEWSFCLTAARMVAEQERR